MELNHQQLATNRVVHNNLFTRILPLVNLRPEESDRTWLLFSAYTLTSIGLRWSEDSTVALFLDKYGAQWLPFIYIASAGMGTVLVFFYSWLQRVLPLRRVIVLIPPGMFLVLVVLRFVLEIPTLMIVAVFLLRLWVDAFYVLHDLNTSIAANQLFNIREIKRAYPLISSGLLVADIFSGFSLPLLIMFVGLTNIIIPTSAIAIMIGSGILIYLSHKYKSVFPELRQQKNAMVQTHARRRLSKPLKRYALLLFIFFALLQIVGVLIDFQYLTELKQAYSPKEIAIFLGYFSGFAGICELCLQLFLSSRFIEKFSVFAATATLPLCVAVLLPTIIGILGLIPNLQNKGFFWGLVIIKFIDELLRYTFVVSSGPLLFQPIPERIRNTIQTVSGGMAEAFGTGVTGIIILATFWLIMPHTGQHIDQWVLIFGTSGIAIACLGALWILRSHYVDLLVLSTGQGQLDGSNVDLQAFRQAVTKMLKGKEKEQVDPQQAEKDKSSCIQLLTQIDPEGAPSVLSPILSQLSPQLQIISLEAMLEVDLNPTHIEYIRSLLSEENRLHHPRLFTLALRYMAASPGKPNVHQIERLTTPENHSAIRATAAVLLLRYGSPQQNANATKVLQTMLKHPQEQQRLDAVSALSISTYLQTLRLYIPQLIQDPSLNVRCAVLEMIGATHSKEYYPVLVVGLKQKSTRATAIASLTKLGNEALPILQAVAINRYTPEILRMYAWRTIAKIPTMEAVDLLWHHLDLSKGCNRNYILRGIIKHTHSSEQSALFDSGIASKVEQLIEEELSILAEIYAAYVDIDLRKMGQIYLTFLQHRIQTSIHHNLSLTEVVKLLVILQKSLLNLEADICERLLLILKLLYPQDKIQAATFNLRSQSNINLARGLEILEHTIHLSSKPVLLKVFEQINRKHQDTFTIINENGQPLPVSIEPQHQLELINQKLQTIIDAKYANYEQMVVGDRIRRLLTKESSLSDWSLASIINFALHGRIGLTVEQIRDNLRHPTSYVREAAIAYLSMASPRILIDLLPQLQKDPHPLIQHQVKTLMEKYY